MKKVISSRKYVLNHNYGYENDSTEIHKLELRDIEDVKTYVLDIIKNGIVCSRGAKVYLRDRAITEELKIKILSR